MYFLLGIGLVAVYGIVCGANPIFARISYDAGVNPDTLMFLRFAISSVVLVALMKLRKMTFPRGRPLVTLILMGAVGYVVMTYGFFNALTMIPASLVVILVYTNPVFVILIAAIFFKEKITPVKLAALCLSTTGIVLAVGLKGGGNMAGVMLTLTTALFYALYTVVGSRVMITANAVSATTVIMLSAGVVYGLKVAYYGIRLPSGAAGWMAALALALLGTVVAYLTFFAGLKRIGPSNTAIVSTIEPIVGVFLALMVLGETLTLTKTAGGIMIIAAVLLLVWKKPRPAKGTQPVTVLEPS